MYNFILGFIFAILCIPVIDNFTSLLLTIIELMKSYLNVKINNNNLKIQQPNDSEDVKKIGFAYPEEEVIEDECL